MIENELKKLIDTHFTPIFCEIENQSHHHHGHAGSPGTGESHFRVLVVSNHFENMGRVQRHQAVNMLVKPLFDTGLHALTMQLYSPDEYKRI